MAGDLREIDMTKATNMDGKKIRLVGDDGKGYWMEKEDLASVVGELFPDVTTSKRGLANTRHAKVLGNWFTVVGNGIKGKYVKLASLDVYEATCVEIKWCSYGANYETFHVEIFIGVGVEPALWIKNGYQVSGGLSGFRFYVVGRELYMYVPKTVFDAHVFISSQLGTLYDGKDISETIDTSTEISIS